MYITKKEKDALLAASDFIHSNADGADDYAPFQEMQDGLMSIFRKAKKETEKRHHKALVKKYVKKLNP